MVSVIVTHAAKRPRLFVNIIIVIIVSKFYRAYRVITHLPRK